MSNEIAYVPMPFLDKRMEAVLNAARLVQDKVFPDCCYQISEAMALVLNEIGIPAEALACDVYGWNNDFLRYKAGEPISEPKVQKKPEWKNKKNPQRGFKGKQSQKQTKTRADLVPYTLGIHHEQEVEGDGYDGHVICIADGWILDATAHQFNRPAKKMLSSFFNIIPLDKFTEPEERFKQDWMEDAFLTEKSLGEGLVSISSSEFSVKNGMMAYCLRPDIDSDNWLDHTPTARDNIPICAKWIRDVTQQILDGDENGMTVDISHLYATLN